MPILKVNADGDQKMSDRATESLLLKKFQVLSDISKLLNQASEEDFLQVLPEKACELLSVPICILWKIDEQEEKLKIMATAGEVDDEYKKTELDLKHPAVWHLFEKDKVLSLPNVANINKFRLADFDQFKKREQIVIRKGFFQLRKTAERMQKSLLLLKHSSQQDLQVAIMWMGEKGKIEELLLLWTVKNDPPYQDEDIQNLLELAVKKIVRRIRLGYPNMRDQVIEFTPPVVKDWREQLEATGANILRPLGRLKFVVSVPNPELIKQIESIQGVSKISSYVPKISIQPQYLQNLGQKATKEAIATARLNTAKTPPSLRNPNIPLPGILIANFFTEEDRDRASNKLENEGIRIANRPGKTKLILDLSSHSDATESLETITKQVGLQSLQEKTIPRLFNDKARYVIAENVIPSNPRPNPNNMSLTGKDEIVAVADTGLDTGDTEILHPDFKDRVIMLESYPITTSLPQEYLVNFGDDDGPSDKYSGHGTHVAGSILGTGAQAKNLGLPSIPAGMAPEAKLIFQSIEQTTEWTQEGILYYLIQQGTMPPRASLFGIPDDLQTLFEPAYNQGARIHSNSWGEGFPGDYDNRCEELDQFVWKNKDFLVVVAAGNDGKQTSSATPAIDQGSVTSPGTAKNCLTVGASENNRVNQFSDTYGQKQPDRFPYNPFNSDNMADSVDDIAAFSSRGPCQDGRYKPDVIAPGTFILSTRSSQIASNNFADGAYPPAVNHYMYMHGTSMATPLVAGCAALVRQYLREYQKISNPNAALVKAVLIHSAEYINYRYQHPSSSPWVDNEQGWGRINLCQVLNPTPPTKVFFFDEKQGLAHKEEHNYKIKVENNQVPLRATLVYMDYPGEELINNLNLTLYSPSGKPYLGNDFEGTGNPDNINNVEGMIVESPDLGVWTIKINAPDIYFDVERQDYALVISGGLSETIS